MRQRRRYFTQCGQARLLVHGLGPVKLTGLQLLALGDVNDGTHPAGLLALGVNQWRLKHHYVEQVPVTVTPHRLIALARRLTRKVALVAHHHFFNRIGWPVGHRRGQTHQVFSIEPHHLAKRAVDVKNASLGVAGTQAHERRIFHRPPPSGIGAPCQFGGSHVQHLATQKIGG